MHSSKGIIGSKGDSLKEKLIVLSLTGSIAVVKAFDLCRELMRRGAEVQVIMSEKALELIGEQTMHYASGEKVIKELTGEIEHVEFLGIGGKADLLLIAPATANTVGKIAQGIDDTVVTTFATTALGAKKPVIIVPAMHESMYEHEIVLENIEKLKSIGVKFVEPRKEEGKAKIAELGEIVLEVEGELSEKPLKGKKVLVTGGAVWEEIDDARILSSKASGKTGEELARQAYRLGAEVCLIHNGVIEAGIENVSVKSSREMYKEVMKRLENGFDVFVCSAAISDFEVKKTEGKIKSDKKVNLRLKPRKKLIELVKESFPKLFVVGFKAEAKLSRGKAVKIGKEKSRKWNLAVVNDVKAMGSEENRAWIVSGKKVVEAKGKKEVIARKVFEEIAKNLNKKLKFS